MHVILKMGKTRATEGAQQQNDKRKPKHKDGEQAEKQTTTQANTSTEHQATQERNPWRQTDICRYSHRPKAEALRTSTRTSQVA